MPFVEGAGPLKEVREKAFFYFLIVIVILLLLTLAFRGRMLTTC